MVDLQHLLDEPERRDHFVQLYTDERALARNVARYLHEGLSHGDSGVVIATSEHRDAFRTTLASRGVDVRSAERTGRLLLLDAEQTLAKFMVRGRPDWARFQVTVSAAVDSLTQGRRVRAYGEMVGILWTAGEYSAAIALEEHWNRILNSIDATLFCAYPIDIFGPEFDASAVHAILCDHTHLLPADKAGLLESSLGRAMHAVLGETAGELQSRIAADYPSDWGRVPSAERTILWLRKNLPRSSQEIVRLTLHDYRNLTSAHTA